MGLLYIRYEISAVFHRSLILEHCAELIFLLDMLLSCSFYRYPELVFDLIAYHNTYLYAMVAFSTGNTLHSTKLHYKVPF